MAVTFQQHQFHPQAFGTRPDFCQWGDQMGVTDIYRVRIQLGRGYAFQTGVVKARTREWQYTEKQGDETSLNDGPQQCYCDEYFQACTPKVVPCKLQDGFFCNGCNGSVSRYLHWWLGNNGNPPNRCMESKCVQSWKIIALLKLQVQRLPAMPESTSDAELGKWWQRGGGEPEQRNESNCTVDDLLLVGSTTILQSLEWVYSAYYWV